MYQLQTTVKDIQLDFVPKDSQAAFIKEILRTYKDNYELTEKLGSPDFYYIDPWSDIGVFLGNYFVMGCCYQEYGESSNIDDLFFEMQEAYNEIDKEHERDRFIRDIEIVLSAHNYSYFDPVYNPHSGDPDDIRVHNNHITEVW